MSQKYSCLFWIIKNIPLSHLLVREIPQQYPGYALCIMHKQVTDSVTERFYVAYLFSRNAKKVFLSIGIGATQFSRIYGESMTKCVPKINDAKEQFKNTSLHLAPNNSNEEMDLFDMSDTNFIRSELSQSPRFKIAAYEAGCSFTKSYTLDDSLDETELQNDLKEYKSI